MIVNPYAPYQNLDEDELPAEEEVPLDQSSVDQRVSAFKEAHKKLKKAGFYDQLVNNAIFSGTEEGDEVNAEIQAWAEAQMFKMLNVNEPAAQGNALAGFTPQEASTLRKLAALSPSQIDALISLTSTVSTLAMASSAPAPRKLPNPGSGTPPQNPPPQTSGGGTPPAAPAQPQPRKARAQRAKKAGEYERVNQNKTVKLQKPPPTAVPFPIGQDFERESYLSASNSRQGFIGASTEVTQGVPTAGSDVLSGLIMGALNKPE